MLVDVLLIFFYVCILGALAFFNGMVVRNTDELVLKLVGILTFPAMAYFFFGLHSVIMEIADEWKDRFKL